MMAAPSSAEPGLSRGRYYRASWPHRRTWFRVSRRFGTDIRLDG